MFTRNTLVALAAIAPMGAFAATSAPFSYDPDATNGPAQWGFLPIDNNACDGKKNSPIAVVTKGCDRYENYDFSRGTCRPADLKYDLTNTGVKASYPDAGCTHPTVKIPGIDGTYKALQFHIHTSSEHTIDGEYFGAELHTVHAEVDGDRYAVVGMMIQPDADEENRLFELLLDGWQESYTVSENACATSRGGRQLEEPGRKLLADAEQVVIAPYDLIENGSTFYHYDGGLTTPPCSEVVWWNLADKPVSITPSQYARLARMVLRYTDASTCELGTNAGPAGSTSRPPQPLNGRIVERICPAGFDDGMPSDEPTDESSSSSSVDTDESDPVDATADDSPAATAVLTVGAVVVAAVSMLI